jgi:hypothetical protein
MVDLPLPEPDFMCGDQSSGESAYTEAQMLEYARKAVEAERNIAMPAVEKAFYKYMHSVAPYGLVILPDRFKFADAYAAMVEARKESDS